MILAKNIVFIFSILLIEICFGQVENEKLLDTTSVLKKASFSNFKLKQIIIPSTLIGYGLIGLNNNTIKEFNFSVKNNFQNQNRKSFILENYTIFMPSITVFSLELFNLKSKNNIKNKTIVTATSSLILATTIISLKQTTKVLRPDRSTYNSFPSGHTAVAFMGAEMLFQEYKDQSIWFGIAGYTIATGSGFLRIYHNRHWLTDVVAGAGIGILATKSAYWLQPILKKMINNSSSNFLNSLVFVPVLDQNNKGFGLISTF